jgi:hypothetical protein
VAVWHDGAEGAAQALTLWTTLVWRNSDDFGMEHQLTKQDVVDAIGSARDVVVLRADLRHGGLSAGALVTPKSPHVLNDVQLQSMGVAGYWVALLKSVGSHSAAVLGLVDKYAGIMAVDSFNISGSKFAVRNDRCVLILQTQLLPKSSMPARSA